jgi:hypothetical protein
MRIPNRSMQLALLAAVVVVAPVANATMTLPGGDTLLSGAFDDLRYGPTGASFVTPLLFLGDLAATDAPGAQATVTDLTYSYVLSGLGTPAASILYTISNDGIDPFTDLRFMVNVQADGSNSFLDTVNVVFGPAAAGDPDQFQVGDFSIEPVGALLADHDGADGSNACGAAACDADLALQWNLASLDPGAVWLVQISLSDDGSRISDRYLQAISADSDSALTFSGVASVVPEPTTGLLFLGGLVGLVALRSRWDGTTAPASHPPRAARRRAPRSARPDA